MTDSAENQTPKVHVVDDDPGMRDSVSFLLESVGIDVAC